MHRFDDEVFDRGRILRRMTVIDHREIRLVAAFAEDAPRGDIAGHVITVSNDPESLVINFPLEPQGIIDDNFTGQEDHGHIVAKAPRLNDVRYSRRQRLAAIEPRDERTGQKSRGPRFLGLRHELLAVGKRLQWQFDSLEAAGNAAGQGSQRRLDQPVDFTPRGGTVLLGVVKVAARLGIGVGPAADDADCDRAGRLLFDQVARVARPLGTDLVELAPQGGAMAGITEENGLDLTGGVGRRSTGKL